MTDSAKAVFLSYASQDAEAAKKICEALRQAGVEVWFDQSELRGGDAWDAMIRKRIKECALFVPIISANTQARTEGYFRLEWRLADQRTHLMAKGRPFLLPVVIDATRDADAHVPDSFLDVQWTNLRNGEAGAAFAARVAGLLAGPGAAPAPAGSVHPGRERPAARRFNPLWLFLLIPGAILLVATGGMMLKRYRDTGSIGSASPPATPVSEAQSLVAKARALLDDDPLMTRANVELAEQLSLQAIARDPTDGEAQAVAAWTNFRFIEGNYEDTPKRRADLRAYAERARLLAPDSINAELAITGVLLATDNRPEATLRLRALADRTPGNLTVLRAYAGAAPWGGGVNWGDDEMSDPAALARLRAHSPLGRSYADSFLANQHWAKGEYIEADRVLDAVFAAPHPVRLTYLLRLLLLTYGWGDLPAARDFSATLPAKLLLEDVFITHVTNVWLYSGDHANALATLERTQREMLQEAKIRIPTGLLRGEVLAAGGRPAAAAIQWRAGLAVVDQRLGGNPADAMLHLQRAYLLIRLDDRQGAAVEFGLAQEILNPPAGSVPWGWGYGYFALTGDFENAIPRIDRLIARDNGRWPNDYNNLRYDPAFAGLRQDPRTQAILARGARWLAEMKAGTKVPAPATVAAGSDAKSIAVLPFENRSAGGEDAAFLADGIHEDLINTLSRVPGLKVMSRTAVERFRATKTGMADLATALKVSHVVEAGVQRAGNQVRINVQLVQATDGRTVWSERYDRGLTADGIFALQEEITAAIAQALQLQLEPDRRGKLVTGTTTNLAAYEAFLKGRQLWKTKPSSSDSEAITLLRRAVELDPGFAIAHGALAEAYVSLGNAGLETPAKAYPLAREAAERALAIDPRCIQALTALGEHAFHYEWDWDKSDRLLRQALVVDPNYANAYGWLGGHLRALNREAEGKSMEVRKAELEPERPLSRQVNELEGLLEGKEFAAAVAAARQVAGQHPGNPFVIQQLGSTLRRAGQQPEAVQVLEKAMGDFPEHLRICEELAITCAEMGQTARVRELLARLGVVRETRFVSPLIFARIAVAMNERELALAEIERAVQLRDPILPSIGIDQNLSPLRDDPRFRRVLQRLKLDAYFPEGVKE